jgi:hypothetical protein
MRKPIKVNLPKLYTDEGPPKVVMPAKEIFTNAEIAAHLATSQGEWDMQSFVIDGRPVIIYRSYYQSGLSFGLPKDLHGMQGRLLIMSPFRTPKPNFSILANWGLYA